MNHDDAARGFHHQQRLLEGYVTLLMLNDVNVVPHMDNTLARHDRAIAMNPRRSD